MEWPSGPIPQPIEGRDKMPAFERSGLRTPGTFMLFGVVLSLWPFLFWVVAGSAPTLWMMEIGEWFVMIVALLPLLPATVLALVAGVRRPILLLIAIPLTLWNLFLTLLGISLG